MLHSSKDNQTRGLTESVTLTDVLDYRQLAKEFQNNSHRQFSEWTLVLTEETALDSARAAKDKERC